MKKHTYYFYGALIMLSIVMLNMIHWIVVSSDNSKSFLEVKEEYLSFYPGFIRGGMVLTLINIILLSLAIALFSVSQNENRFRIISKVLIVFSALLAALNGWSLL